VPTWQLQACQQTLADQGRACNGAQTVRKGWANNHQHGVGALMQEHCFPNAKVH